MQRASCHLQVVSRVCMLSMRLPSGTVHTNIVILNKEIKKKGKWYSMNEIRIRNIRRTDSRVCHVLQDPSMEKGDKNLYS